MGVFNKLFLKDDKYKRTPERRRDMVSLGESLYEQRMALEYEIDRLIDELKSVFLRIEDTKGIFQDMDMTFDISIDPNLWLNECKNLFEDKEDVIEKFKRTYSRFIDQLIKYSNDKLCLKMKLVKKTWYKNQNRLSARVRLDGESLRDYAKGYTCVGFDFGGKKHPKSYKKEDIVKFCLGEEYYEAYCYIMDELPKVSVFDVRDNLHYRSDIIRRVDFLMEKLPKVIKDLAKKEDYYLEDIDKLYKIHDRFFDNYFLQNL